LYQADEQPDFFLAAADSYADLRNAVVRFSLDEDSHWVEELIEVREILQGFLKSSASSAPLGEES
jgi:hypothetical protein